MEPKFITNLTMDKQAMLEWYKKDFQTNHRVFAFAHIGFIVVYLIMAAAFFFNAVQTGLTLFWVAGVVLVVLAVLFLCSLLLQYRLQVWLALRKDKGEAFGKKYSLLFYDETVVMMLDFDAENPEHLRRAQFYVNYGEGMKEEFARLLAEMEGADLENASDDELRLMRDKLEDLQSRMESLSRSMEDINSQIRLDYGSLTDYLQSPGLHILYFDGQAVLANKKGFVRGDEADFKPFLRQIVAKTLGETENDEARAKLARALEKEL